MARCSYHPKIETELSCTECGKPICPKEMVLTPIGYKCPEHARPARGQVQYVKPTQLLKAGAAGVGVGVLSGVILGFIAWGGLLLGVLWGALTAEAVRRASGGHRESAVAAIGVLSIGLGWLVGFFVRGVSPLTAIIAVVVVLFQMAVIGRR